MKNILKTMLLGITLASCQPTDTKSYLKEVIANLENIETASYQIEEHHWFPGPCQIFGYNENNKNKIKVAIDDMLK